MNIFCCGGCTPPPPSLKTLIPAASFTAASTTAIAANGQVALTTAVDGSCGRIAHATGGSEISLVGGIYEISFFASAESTSVGSLSLAFTNSGTTIPSSVISVSQNTASTPREIGKTFLLQVPTTGATISLINAGTLETTLSNLSVVIKMVSTY